MTAGRTVTVQTIDSGPITLTCPTWCITRHADQDGGHRADITHEGTETALHFHGHRLLAAGLVLDPYSQTRPRVAAALVDLGREDWTRLDPDELAALAAGLVDHAWRLRELSSRLSVLRAKEAGR